MLYRTLESNLALQRIQKMRGTANAIALAFAKDGKRPESVADDLRDADLEEG